MGFDGCGEITSSPLTGRFKREKIAGGRQCTSAHAQIQASGARKGRWRWSLDLGMAMDGDWSERALPHVSGAGLRL